MNSEDRRIVIGELNAEVNRHGGVLDERTLEPIEKTEATEPAERISSDSDSASFKASRNMSRDATSMSRMQTQTDDVMDLSRHPTALSRIETYRTQHSHTIAAGENSRTASRQSKTALPPFGAGKPFPPDLPSREQYVVEFDGPDDPLHGQNWPLRKKLPVAIVLGYFTLVSTFGSSIYSTAEPSVQRVFGIEKEVSILGLSLYVLGYATGPMIWAPSSELYGRKWPLLVAAFGFSIFQIATATAKDVQTVFLGRFFSGFFGACPIACVGAVFADIFNNSQRGLAMTLFATAVFSGPLLAPFIGGFIVTSHLGWRWTQYITAIMGFLALGLCFIFLEETYPPAILMRKAADLRRRTKNWGIHSKQEEIEVDFTELIEKNFSRPIRMLFTEPIVLLISIYMAFIYGLLYLFLKFYPIVFQGIHGFKPGIGGLPFFGMIVGYVICCVYIFANRGEYNKKLRANNGIPVPEWRMPTVFVGGISFAIGLFWFGWSGYKKDIHWIVPTLSGLCTGFGILAIFLQCLNFLVDAYLMFAASALAANTFLRSLAGATFPLFAGQMIDSMGIQWAGTLLGCVALALLPMPLVFIRYGRQIRESSSFAPTFPIASQAALRAVAQSDLEKNE